MATRVIKPPAQLKPRNSSERRVSDAESASGNEISYEQLKKISIFKDVKYERIDLRALPDTIVLRRYAAGEPICDQDHPGYTAFYVLTAQEVGALNLPPLPASDIPADQVLLITRKVPSQANRKKMVEDNVHMGEGELFGEMSCLYRVPRSATVRATRDCYVLEFLRNVLDKINTGTFRSHLDDIYRKRFLELHLRHLELFRHLKDEEYLKLRDGVELRSLMPGEMLFDEHDRPDGLYIIRGGFVKIVKNVSALLGDKTIANWPAFLAALSAGRPKLGEHVVTLLPDDADCVTVEQKRDLLFAINDLLKLKDFAAKLGFEFSGAAAGWADQAKKLAAAKKEDPAEIRRFNRQLLESLLPNLILPYGIDPPRVVAYRSSPDWVASSAASAAASSADSSLIGEIALRDGTPRSATCIAYGQSDDRYGGVRVVYIKPSLYEELVRKPESSSALQSQARLAEVAGEREAQTSSRMSVSVWQQESVNQQFEELGLIQGQKLMLIDLDRCTRCDKCVEACVTSHTPGWLDWLPIVGNDGPRDGRSRLFLDGPRIQIYEDASVKNYLVPSTCRQCKDPVCLIGCPVGSIHKGDNGQIVIEDWCIGCTRCAMNCPYNAIQMHPIGVIPRSSAGWHHRQGAGRPTSAATPFSNNRDFRAWYRADEPIEFAYTFNLSAATTGSSKTFLLHVVSSATDVTAAINGQAIELRRHDAREAKQKGWPWEAMLAHIDEPAPTMLPGEKQPQPLLRGGGNTLTITLSLAKSTPGEVLLDAGLTGYVPPTVDKSVAGDEYKQDWVMSLAVVCDMCSGQFGQKPACVTACPHEAAERRFITYDTFLPAPKL